MRLMTSGWPFSPGMNAAPTGLLLRRRGLRAGLGGALDVGLELGESRPLRGIEHLAAELHRNRRHGIVQARKQRDLDALERLRALLQLLLDEPWKRSYEPVGKQNAEERADQRMCDKNAELLGR